MKLIKTIGAALYSGLLLFAISCNQGDKKNVDDAVLKPDSDTTKKNVHTPKPANIMIIKHRVADFNKWLTAYKTDDSVRLI